VTFVDNLKEEVTHLLKREVVLMREILSSMCNEERALIEKNPKALQEVMLERDKPLEDLKNLREEISQKFKKFIHSSGLKLKPQEFTLVDYYKFLDESGFETLEIMLLADQMVALTEKMNLQSLSNTHLMDDYYLGHWQDMMQGSLKKNTHHPSCFRAKEEKRRGSMLSLQILDEEET
jgi:hypothetical protein